MTSFLFFHFFKTTNCSLNTPSAFTRERTHAIVQAGLVVCCLWFASMNSVRAQSSYSPYAFGTLAGLAKVPGSADGTNITARFHFPSGVALDGVGNVYVADTYNNSIRKITPAGVVTTLAGGTSGGADGTGSAAQFRGPTGVAVDSSDNVYVADKSNHTIRKITPSGVVTTLAGLAEYRGNADGTGSVARFWYPTGVAVDDQDHIYVADTSNDAIRKITPGGVVATLAGGTGGSADGVGTSAQFSDPTGVAVDGAGNVYVADYYNSTIRKVTAGGTVTTVAGLAEVTGSADGTGSNARFHYPSDVAVDEMGVVYVADVANQLIRRVATNGSVTTLAGLAGVSGAADGTGPDARFDAPTGVAVDSTGNLLVADYYNDTIREGSPILILSPYFLANGEFHLLVIGPVGFDVVISASSNGTAWSHVTTNELIGGIFDYTDPAVSNFTSRFYRAHLN